MTFPAFPFGETVTLVTRTRSGEDSDGNDQFTTTTTDVPHVPVYPRDSSELVQGQDTVIEGLTVLLPASENVAAIDAIIVRGLQYEVDGRPEFYPNPFTGATSHPVNITRVDG